MNESINFYLDQIKSDHSTNSLTLEKLKSAAEGMWKIDTYATIQSLATLNEIEKKNSETFTDYYLFLIHSDELTKQSFASSQLANNVSEKVVKFCIKEIQSGDDHRCTLALNILKGAHEFKDLFLDEIRKLTQHENTDVIYFTFTALAQLAVNDSSIKDFLLSFENDENPIVKVHMLTAVSGLNQWNSRIEKMFKAAILDKNVILASGAISSLGDIADYPKETANLLLEVQNQILPELEVKFYESLCYIEPLPEKACMIFLNVLDSSNAEIRNCSVTAFRLMENYRAEYHNSLIPLLGDPDADVRDNTFDACTSFKELLPALEAKLNELQSSSDKEIIKFAKEKSLELTDLFTVD